jgi:hypothetical protein
VLAQYVAGAGAARFSVQLSVQYGLECCDAFNDLEPVGRDQKGLGRGIIAVVCAPDPLDKTFHVLWRADLDNQINVTPVDAQIKAACADDCPQIAAYHCCLYPFTLGAIKGTVMDTDGQAVVICQPQVVKENLGLCAGVMKDQRRGVLTDLIKNGGDRIGRTASSPWRGLGCAEHLNIGGRTGIRQENGAGIGVARHEVGNGSGVFDGGGQPDAFQVRAQRLQACQSQHQLIAAFAFCEGMDFVNHHPFQAFEHARCILVRGEQGEAFGGG